MNPLIVITGPTASGKTHRAVTVAQALNGEIVSADSRQLYRGMDLGTGKDIEEYGTVPYHLINVADAGERLNLFNYLTMANAAIEEITGRGKVPILCGGTGMYVEAVVNGLALPEVPENPSLRKTLEGKSLRELTAILSAMKRLHNVTDVDTCKRAIRAIEIASYYTEHPDAAEACKPRPRNNAVIIGVDIDRDTRRARISHRLVERLDAGMVEEVKSLIERGVKPENLIYYGLEYKFITLHVIGQLSRNEMIVQLETAIHQFAKRQMTWFRGMERRGLHINWLPWDMPDDEFVAQVLKLSVL